MLSVFSYQYKKVIDNFTINVWIMATVSHGAINTKTPTIKPLHYMYFYFNFCCLPMLYPDALRIPESLSTPSFQNFQFRLKPFGISV